MFMKKDGRKKPMGRKGPGGKGGGRRGPGRGPGRGRIFRKKPCKFCLDKVQIIDFMDYQKFTKFITERGKITPSRITGTCARHQRQLAKAIRKARVAGLIPFVAE